MKKQRNSLLLAFVAVGAIFIASCSKDDPQPEIPQEETHEAQLTFTEVEWQDGQPVELEHPEVMVVTFEDGLAAVGTHIHLEAEKTYKVELTAYDFAGREIQQEFVDDASVHQAFILGAPDGVLDYTYADPADARVGVTGYLHVLQPSDGFVLNYILRHLNEGEKARITAGDWNNAQYTQFGGANDIDLKFEVHAVEAGHGHDH